MLGFAVEPLPETILESLNFLQRPDQVHIGHVSGGNAHHEGSVFDFFSGCHLYLIGTIQFIDLPAIFLHFF